MEAQIAQFTNRGMYQDTSISKATNEFAFKNYNIRITAIEDNTLLSISNEKLPLDIHVDIDGTSIIKGTYLGHAVLNEYLVLFTKSEEADRIYRFKFENEVFKGVLLFENDLGFLEVDYIETLAYYESEDIQKVYWVDGKHQPRFINIVSNKIKPNDGNQFDFNPTINKFPKGTIVKNYDAKGSFPSGVIQYFITYYNKYGIETGIVWASDLHYITEYNRGEAPDKNVNCTFTLNFENLDTNFEYIKVYSLYRTSYNGETVAQIVTDRKVADTLSITDTNFNNEIIDPSSLFFLGGNNFIAETLAQKDNTLLLVGITAKTEVIPASIIEALTPIQNENGEFISKFVKFETKNIGKASESITEEFQLNKSEKDVKTFKFGEYYRFAIQFQTPTSTWTSPIWIGDSICNIKPSVIDKNILVANATVSFDLLEQNVKDKINDTYINYRLLIAEATNADRKVVAQGVVSPTVFNYKDRIDKSGAYAISSWLMRPRNGIAANNHMIGLGNKVEDTGKEYKFYNLETCEIQNSINRIPLVDKRTSEINYIFSSKFEGNNLDYYIFRGNSPSDIIYLDAGNIEDIVLHNTITIENPSDSTEFNGALYKMDDDISNSLGINLGISVDTLFVWYQTFRNSDNEYLGTYKVMYYPDGNIYYDNFSCGYFYQPESGTSGIIKSTNTLDAYGCYGVIKGTIALNVNTDKYENNYYVDNSIVTFHSPEIDGNESLFDDSNLNFDIVGIVPITNIKSDINLSLETDGIKSYSKLVKNIFDDDKTLVNDALFKDGDVYMLNGQINIIESPSKYYLYLWNKSESIVGQTANWQSDKNYAWLKSKIMANHNFSLNSNYFDTDKWDAIQVNTSIFDADQIVTKTLKIEENTVLYQGNYETLLATSDIDSYGKGYSYRVFKKKATGLIEPLNDPQYSPVSIKYKSTPHLMFSSGANLLSYLKDNNETNWQDKFKSFYELKDNFTDDYSLGWFVSGSNAFDSYIQKSIDNEQCDTPYFFLGELQKVVDYDTLYGGTDSNAIEKINWIVASDAYKTSETIDKSYGDTYYQRYDCLKTYPFTREDKNSVIDITSFMVETHVNLLGRYDKHKELDDILNVDNTNFTQINDVYSQPNNFFTYTVLDEKYQNIEHSNQITYSLNKIPTSDIDLWTSITLSSAFNLDGSKGKLNKIINFNDTLITFQDRAISAINFNNRTALSTESGVPIEIANSGKVNGYSIIIDNVGCQNKQSICQASSGIYFIDDLNRTFYNFNKEGISNISSKGMSLWFKQNLTSKEKVFYDCLTHDVYLTNKDYCITYNEDLQSFVSFMDYNDIDSLFNLEGNTFILKNESTIIPKKMFAGDYTGNYSIEYKINPEPLIDKTFTNIEYIADCIPNNVKIDTVGKTLNLPFDKLNVWNEYQEGYTSLTSRYSHPNFERKFRIWRVDVPRDTKEGRSLNRIRNPWMYLKLSKDSNDKDKMVFHNLIVKYYK